MSPIQKSTLVSKQQVYLSCAFLEELLLLHVGKTLLESGMPQWAKVLIVYILWAKDSQKPEISGY